MNAESEPLIPSPRRDGRQRVTLNVTATQPQTVTLETRGAPSSVSSSPRGRSRGSRVEGNEVEEVEDPRDSISQGDRCQVLPRPRHASESRQATFGQLRSTVEKTVGLGTNRQIQFALRFNF